MEDETMTSTGSCGFLERYASQIAGQLGCWDRLVLPGTLQDVGYSGALEKRLQQDHIRCFDLKEFAQPLREAMRRYCYKGLGPSRKNEEKGTFRTNRRKIKNSESPLGLG
jgi:hypothetical protein